MRAAAVTPPVLAATLTALLFQLGCGAASTDTLPNASTACPNAMAEILVMDGPVQRLCGCDEGRGEPTATGMTCTIPMGHLVTFHFLGSLMRHQIMPDGPLNAPATTVIDPLSKTRDAVVGFQDRGSYPFRDAYAPTVSGTIVVR